MTLHAHLLKKLADSSSQHPVLLDTLRKSAAALGDDTQQLYDALDQMHAAGEVNRVAGYKEGKHYVAYWLIPRMAALAPVYAPYRATPIPDAAITAPPAKITQTAVKRTVAPKIEPTKKETTTMANTDHPRLGTGRAALLQHICDKPGLNRQTLMEWYAKNIAGADLSKARSTLGNLRTSKQIIIDDKGGYHLAGSIAQPTKKQPAPAKAKQTAPKIPVSETRPSQARTSNGHTHATKAALHADLLCQDISALTASPLPLIRDLAIDMLASASTLKRKLQLLAAYTL